MPLSGTESSPMLFRYYLLRIGSKARLRARLAVLAASDEASGPSTARFSAKLNDAMFKLLQDIERNGGIKQSDVVKGLIVQIKKDILDDKRADIRKDLQDLMRLAG